MKSSQDLASLLNSLPNTMFIGKAVRVGEGRYRVTSVTGQSESCISGRGRIIGTAVAIKINGRWYCVQG